MLSSNPFRALLTLLSFLLLAAFAGACDNDGKPPPQRDGSVVEDGGDADGDVDSSVNSDCPTAEPIGAECEGSAVCEYGTETCCGETFASLRCRCSNGMWACLATDACYRPADSCGDAGTDAGNDSGI